MSTKKFDLAVPRKMFWSKDINTKELCPECHTKLENENQTYMFAVREHGEIETFITGNDGGYFCPNCPVIVLDWDVFADFISITKQGSHQVEFTVLGIVDLDAVPEEKQDIPLGEEDNPIPLVEFIKSDKPHSKRGTNRRLAGKAQRKRMKHSKKQKKRK